jgi:hypothetical protein
VVNTMSTPPERSTTDSGIQGFSRANRVNTHGTGLSVNSGAEFQDNVQARQRRKRQDDREREMREKEEIDAQIRMMLENNEGGR